MEDPDTGADLGQTGGFSWHDNVPPELSKSFEKALAGGRYDSEGGGHYYWDSEENRWWTWDTPEVITKKFPAIMEEKKLGGVFAWGLGEDGNEWKHLRALTAGWKEYSKRTVEESGSRSSSVAKANMASDRPMRQREEL